MNKINLCNCDTCEHHDKFVTSVKCKAQYCGGHLCCIDAKPKPSLSGARQISDSEYEGIKQRGCLSHPQAREYLNKDVIEELERLYQIAVKYEGIQEYTAYDTVIELLKKDVQK